ncbi:MAG: hypothetical protein K2M43_00380, partial [Mycoplasmoidaceae bacterium]|nr:hypothetical protein [Mycoplasmoidaceae bacterium]
MISPFNDNFSKVAVANPISGQTDFGTIFGYNPNYLGLYDKTYQSLDLEQEDNVEAGFISNGDYYNYCSLPFYNGKGGMSATDGMGFMGIQTSLNYSVDSN